MRKIYKLWDYYINADNITCMTKPVFDSYINNNLKDEYCETGTKEQKTVTVWIDGKKYFCANYWDSGYNCGIDKKSEQIYEEYEKEVLELFNAYINSVKVTENNEGKKNGTI